MRHPWLRPICGFAGTDVCAEFPTGTLHSPRRARIAVLPDRCPSWRGVNMRVCTRPWLPPPSFLCQTPPPPRPDPWHHLGTAQGHSAKRVTVLDTKGGATTPWHPSDIQVNMGRSQQIPWNPYPPKCLNNSTLDIRCRSKGRIRGDGAEGQSAGLRLPACTQARW